VSERPHFCPFCGEPVGSFFGRFGADGSTWCERCQEWFVAARAGERSGNEYERPIHVEESEPPAAETP
jgi:hypothetical protein